MDIIEEIPGCSRDVTGMDDDEGFLDHRYENTGLIPQIDKPMSIPFLCCKLWRWKELQVSYIPSYYFDFKLQNNYAILKFKNSKVTFQLKRSYFQVANVC